MKAVSAREAKHHFGQLIDEARAEPERALDTMRRLLEAVSAKETAEKISASRDTILRTKYAELASTAAPVSWGRPRGAPPRTQGHRRLWRAWDPASGRDV